ncbi:MAG: signal recognition particle protein, partial [Flavobacteriaceae bacterium]
KLLDYSRKKRIAKGAGMQMDDINKLVKQFEQMSKMMKMMQGGKASKLMQMFGK